MGVVPPERGFLTALRRLCDGSGALLIFDEVITGFRVARGGAQERFGISPDLTVLGKIAGGGLPLAAFGGRSEIMDRLAPGGDVYQAGTLSGNPLATAAGLAVLRRLRDPHVAALAVGLTLIFFGQVHAFLFPILPTAYVATGDGFGVVAYGLLLLSIMWRTAGDPIPSIAAGSSASRTKLARKRRAVARS